MPAPTTEPGTPIPSPARASAPWRPGLGRPVVLDRSAQHRCPPRLRRDVAGLQALALDPVGARVPAFQRRSSACRSVTTSPAVRPTAPMPRPCQTTPASSWVAPSGLPQGGGRRRPSHRGRESATHSPH
jgi:hypothetical protein